MINITVKLFASAKDIAGTDDMQISIPENSPAFTVLDELIRHNAQFAKWKDYLRLAVNCRYVFNDHVLHDNDEVAVIPPVSGG